jgi:hypothetical protein
MKNYRTRLVAAALAGLFAAGLTTSSKADTGTVRVVFTKGGFVVGAGSGRGVLVFKGHRYPFRVAGMSVGFTIGVSTTNLQGQALNMTRPTDLNGSYAVLGAGAAVAAGAGGVTLQNSQTGVVLQLAGAKVGAEVSAAVGGVTVTLE